MSNPEEKPNDPQENPAEPEASGRKAEPTTVPQDKEGGTTVPQDDA
ncbi:MAG: hypothetical protein ABR611_12420 [Chthoniobacterales bacterium]